ncbi:MAG: Membrane protein, partial [Pedobacter sp.]|nr:Membrane protein [Pedobacter sp.]
MFFGLIKISLTAFLFFSIVTTGFGQQTEVTGTVKDAKNKLPLSYVTVSFKGTSIQTRTDQDGKFTIKSATDQSMLQLDFIGYRRIRKAIKPHESQDLEIQMLEESQQLTEVKVTAGRSGPYKNKNNPAVELIR